MDRYIELETPLQLDNTIISSHIYILKMYRLANMQNGQLNSVLQIYIVRRNWILG